MQEKLHFFSGKMHSDQTNLNQEKIHLLDTESQQVNKSTFALFGTHDFRCLISYIIYIL